MNGENDLSDALDEMQKGEEDWSPKIDKKQKREEEAKWFEKDPPKCIP